MKVYRIIAAAIAAVLLAVSCGVLGGKSSKSAMGSSIGESLLAIYSQYKIDGKVDMTNLNNIINLANIANILRGRSFEETDNTEFINGLIYGADNLIDSSNANAVADLLNKMSSIDMSALTDAAKSVGKSSAQAAGNAANAAAAELASSSEVVSAVATLTNILNLMRK